jgi:hypothetical protein
MHFSFNSLRIKSLYMLRALLAHPREALYNRHLVYCVRIMSVGCATTAVKLQPFHNQLTIYARNIPSAVCESPPEDEQVMLETCSGSWFSINWMKNASRWFHYTDILWCTVSKILFGFVWFRTTCMASCCKERRPSGSINSRNFINRLCYMELISFIFVIYTIFVNPSTQPWVFKHIRKLVKSATNFAWHLIFELFSKICRENSSFIKTLLDWWIRDMKTNVHLWYIADLFTEWEMFQRKLWTK